MKYHFTEQFFGLKYELYKCTNLTVYFLFLAQLINITSTNHPQCFTTSDICMLTSKKVNCVSSQFLTIAQAQVYLVCKSYGLHRSFLLRKAKGSELEKVREGGKKKNQPNTKTQKKRHKKNFFSPRWQICNKSEPIQPRHTYTNIHGKA